MDWNRISLNDFTQFFYTQGEEVTEFDCYFFEKRTIAEFLIALNLHFTLVIGSTGHKYH